MEQNFQRFLEEQESIYSSSSFKKVGCIPEKCSANPQIVNSAYTGSLQDLTVQLCFPQILHINHTNTATSTTPDQFHSQALAKLCFGFFALTLFGGLELGFFAIDWVLFCLVCFFNQKCIVCILVRIPVTLTYGLLTAQSIETNPETSKTLIQRDANLTCSFHQL